MFNEISMYPTLPANDIDRAKDWYAEKLDLKPVDEGFGGFFYETENGGRFYLYPSESAGTNNATAAVFVVGDDFDEAITHLRNRDVELMDFQYGNMSTDNGIMETPEGERAAWFEDSEGNILAVSTT